MPGENAQHQQRQQQQQQQRSVLLKSDQDSGMALIKSKDGRTKWLTVSTDPSSPSFTWDERVRSWASKLGVCAQPPPTNQSTPLPTPPPDDFRENPQHWPFPEGTHANANAKLDCVRHMLISPQEKAKKASLVQQKHSESNTSRAGSFARGFLLGLSGGGGNLAAPHTGSSSNIKKQSNNGNTSSRNGDGSSLATSSAGTLEGTSALVAVAAVLPTSTRGASEKQESKLDGSGGGNCDNDGNDDDNDDNDDGGGDGGIGGSDGGSGLLGRNRWVKGAPPSPTNNSSGSIDSHDSGRCGTNGYVTNDHVSDDGNDHKLSDGVNIKSPNGGSHATSPGSPSSVGKDGIGGIGGMSSEDAAACGGNTEWLGINAAVENGNNGDIDIIDINTGAKPAAKKKKKNKGKGKGSKSKKSSSATNSNNNNTNTNSNKTGSQKGTKTSIEHEEDMACSNKRSKNRRASPSVSFGRVKMLEFTRDVGGCGVPGDGTWGLALGIPFRETMVDLEGYEASKAQIMEERTVELSKKQRHLSTGETRQFDHRPVGERNPLFYRLDEKDRSKRLLDYACFHKGDLEQADRDTTTNNANGTALDETTLDETALDETALDETTLDETTQRCEKKTAPLDFLSDFSLFSHKVSHAEFVDKSQEVALELTALRKSRRTSQGCNCVCVRPDKLNVAKLRAELGKRGLKASGCKKELTKMLQEAMRLEGEKDGGQGHTICRSKECQCVKDGVECHADICTCCKGPNIGKKDAHHGGNCGNPEGVYAYSSSKVRSYRGPYVTAKVMPGRERGRSRSDSMCSEHH